MPGEGFSVKAQRREYSRRPGFTEETKEAMRKMDALDLSMGKRVRVLPSHAKGDPDHPDSQIGTVESTAFDCAYVIFDCDVENSDFSFAPFKMIDPDNLRIL